MKGVWPYHLGETWPLCLSFSNVGVASALEIPSKWGVSVASVPKNPSKATPFFWQIKKKINQMI